MAPTNPLQIFNGAFWRLYFTRLIPFVLLLAVLIFVFLILRTMFENWLIRKVKRLRQGRQAKKHAGMTDDEVLDTPHCPVCKRLMKLRTVKRDGSQFWGCSVYPKCRGTRPIEQ